MLERLLEVNQIAQGGSKGSVSLIEQINEGLPATYRYGKWALSPIYRFIERSIIKTIRWELRKVGQPCLAVHFLLDKLSRAWYIFNVRRIKCNNFKSKPIMNRHSTSHNWRKLIVFIDESGQHFRSSIFVVGLLIVGDRDEVEQWAKELDRCKQSPKWHRTKYKNKIEFLKRLKETSFDFFAYTYIVEKFGKDKSHRYQEILIEAITYILKQQEAKKIILFLDGKNNKKFNRRLSAYLRWHKVPVKKIKGVDDNKVPPIRIIDAIVGAVRDYKRERGKELVVLVGELITQGKIIVTEKNPPLTPCKQGRVGNP